MKVQHIFIIGHVYPEPESSAAGQRMLQLIRCFLSQNWKVSFGTTASLSDFSFDLESLGVACISIQLNDSSFDSRLSELNPDVVLFDRFHVEEQFGWRVHESCPDALRILDTEDLHFLRAARNLAVKENRELSPEDLFSDLAKREIASIFRSDLSLIISESEMEILSSRFGINPDLLFYLPLLTTEITIIESEKWSKFNEREDFMFIGDFLHEPNLDAVFYLKQKIWGLIRKSLPKAKIHIYGAYPPEKILQLNKESEGFIVHGRAEDASVVFSKARILLAPLRFGAGIKGKLIQAMCYGTPSITTTIGSEGINGDFPWNGSIADETRTLAETAVQLYKNEGLWENARSNGTNIINGRFQETRFLPDFIQQIQIAINELKPRRLANFTGAMLMQHTTNSSKYLSRWIEEKNK